MAKYEYGNHPVHTWFSCKSKPVDMLGHKNVKVYQARFAFLKPKKGEKGDKYLDLFSVQKRQVEALEEEKIEEEEKPKRKKKTNAEEEAEADVLIEDYKDTVDLPTYEETSTSWDNDESA